MKKTIAMASAIFMFIACSSPKTDDKAAATVDSAVAAPAKPQPTEIGDSKYVDVGKSGNAALSSGNIDAWMSSFSDNAVYIWNNGDSLAGKPAITAYWKQRRGNVIDSINFSMDIWLSVKVNQPQNAAHLPGNWLLGWYLTKAKYKTGKSMAQWIHTDMHFDANDKIDRVVQFLDRAPINAAAKK
ncbi:MAG TPA: nuclear transport factor 2 family protein [Puia sp.]